MITLSKGKKYIYKDKIVTVIKYVKLLDAYLVEYDGEEIYVSQKNINKYCEEKIFNND